ncbi:MAG: hypothetical protein IJS97_01310 [Prevotella sp.]|nr:hypothetical protein [Prevotella sp.]
MKKTLLIMGLSIVLAACNSVSETGDEMIETNAITISKKQNNKDSLLLGRLQAYNQNMDNLPGTRSFWTRLWKAIKYDVYAVPKCAIECNVVGAGVAVINNSTESTRNSFITAIVKTIVKTAQRSYKGYKEMDCSGLSAVYIRNEYLGNVSSHCSNPFVLLPLLTYTDSIMNLNESAFVNDSLPLLAGNLHNIYLNYAMNPAPASISSLPGGNSVNFDPIISPIYDGPILLPTNDYGVPGVLTNYEIESYIAQGDTDNEPDFIVDGDEDTLLNMCGDDIISEATADVMTLFYEALENVSSETALYSLLNYYISETKTSNSLLQTEKNEICLQLEMFRHSYDFWKVYMSN